MSEAVVVVVVFVFFFVTMLQVLKPQHLTRVQEFVNVLFNTRTECYLPN